MSAFEGRDVLVTGAGGSIGSELCRVVMSQNAHRLVLVSLTEAGLYNINRKLEQEFRKYRDTEIVPLLGDCGDERLISAACKDVDTVIHAAAHKHLPICERNACAAIRNNVFSTLRLMQQASRAGVDRFCLVSSDKAVNPTSVMGATKRLAELLIRHMNTVSDTRFFTVRFGNVMDSAGSVIPLWREQIEQGLPITITDERCERYFMSILDAVKLICEAVQLDPSGGTYVLDMGKPVNVLELARRVAGERWPWAINTIGLRPGEKLREELHHGGELQHTGIDRLYMIEEPKRAPLNLQQLYQLQRCADDLRTEDATRLMWELIT